MCFFDSTGAYLATLDLPSGEKRPISVSRGLSYALEIVDLAGGTGSGSEDDSDFFHANESQIFQTL